MDKKTRLLVEALQKKRSAEGLSIRALSKIIGVSFSSLARIERGDGDPDNNSKLRILEWLGDDARESGLSFENVAFVHFRASKNVSSKTTHCLLQAADLLKREYIHQHPNLMGSSSEDSSPADISISLSKPEMEALADAFRKDLGVKENDSLDALNISIEGVDVYVPEQVPNISRDCLQYLKGKGKDEWSAMSVPLDRDNHAWAILRNNTHTIERQRVTFLEECWHIMLGHKLTKIAKIADAYGRTYDSDEEHDAFFLASATMLPEKAITRSVEKQVSAEETAKKFGASPELVEYRIKRLGLWRQYTGRKVTLAEVN
ncbi:MAG: ImmA/IrrE family metallo-endopeptidase [Alphaproteobacteria bacterium]|nr:ImmA/IrrE family metallo-endopeptidase [Alphaproteobacteria bacterium]